MTGMKTYVLWRNRMIIQLILFSYNKISHFFEFMHKPYATRFCLKKGLNICRCKIISYNEVNKVRTKIWKSKYLNEWL